MRPDGTRLRNLTPIVQALPYIMPRRFDAQNWATDYVDEDLLAQKKGICFDYAALMTAMLRSQDIPTKLVVGYTGNLYHAWINVYLEGQGWVVI